MENDCFGGIEKETEIKSKNDGGRERERKGISECEIKKRDTER
jgi:hypothetical protein